MRVSDERLEQLDGESDPCGQMGMAEAMSILRELLAARRVVEAARATMPATQGECEHGPDCAHCYEEVQILFADERRFSAALAAYDEATR